MAPIFDRGAIAGFGDGEDLETQIVVARQAAARVHGDFMMALQGEPAQLGINFCDERAFMSRVASVERNYSRGVAAFPRGFPCVNAGTRSGHNDNLTRRKDKGKRSAR